MEVLDSYIMGYHEYQKYWIHLSWDIMKYQKYWRPFICEKLLCQMEPDNMLDKYS